MDPIPVIAVFDVGRTNKKFFLFDEDYRKVYEKSVTLEEITDEDGDICENLIGLKEFIIGSLKEAKEIKAFTLKAINFSGYGASLVYVDKEGEPIAPLYSYLKPYPEKLQEKFYSTYGGEEQLSLETASPILGSLNSGLQLYRVKYERPELFSRIKYALHLPQYLSLLVTGQPCSDITSVGCHTHLWDFCRNKYHQWVEQENLTEKLAPLTSSDRVFPVGSGAAKYIAGAGLHDSSAALIPYLDGFSEPFILLSTGTWCISLNPFNHTPLTAEELSHDCLCYMQYQGKPVKASRLFSGHEHEQQVKRIAAYFNQDAQYYSGIAFNPEIASGLQRNKQDSVFTAREPADFSTGEEAYHQLISDLIRQQHFSTGIVLKGAKVKKIFVDGGFSRNAIFMHLLAQAFPGIEVFAASMAQASATGAAVCIHHAWNTKALPTALIELKYYPGNSRQ